MLACSANIANVHTIYANWIVGLCIVGIIRLVWDMLLGYELHLYQRIGERNHLNLFT